MKFRDLFDKETMCPNWEIISEIPEFSAMIGCKQSETWHKEGDVWEHTKQVTNAMYNYLIEHKIDRKSERYLMMMSAAICHDLGKPLTTYFDKEKNDYKTKCHGIAGARITRRLFFDEEIMLREKVCYMVSKHMILHHVFDKDNLSEKNIIALSHGLVTVEDMAILCYSDSNGSINIFENEDNNWNHFVKVMTIVEKYKCEKEPYRFENGYKKLYYFRNNDVTLEELNNDDYADEHPFTVYIMIGGPGSGKNYYIEHRLKNIKSISRDDIRTEIGLKGEKPIGNKKMEDVVTEIFNHRVLDCCNKEEDFVINNTNVKKKYRYAFIDMLLPFHPRIVYVYVEAPSIEIQKKRREGMMPMSVIDKMWNDLDFPDYTECNELIIEKQKKEPYIINVIKNIFRK